jgi:hypothetical protein
VLLLLLLLVLLLVCCQGGSNRRWLQDRHRLGGRALGEVLLKAQQVLLIHLPQLVACLAERVEALGMLPSGVARHSGLDRKASAAAPAATACSPVIFAATGQALSLATAAQPLRCVAAAAPPWPATSLNRVKRSTSKPPTFAANSNGKHEQQQEDGTGGWQAGKLQLELLLARQEPTAPCHTTRLRTLGAFEASSASARHVRCRAL